MYGRQEVQPLLEVSGELHISHTCVCSSSSVQVSGGICSRSVQNSNNCCTLLGGGSLALQNPQHIERRSSLVSIIRISSRMFQ